MARQITIIAKVKLDSAYFDRIRIKPKRQRQTQSRTARKTCEWPGCNQAGDHRAPKGRAREGEYHNFCVDHVREYNKSYNYFAGMDDDELRRFQTDGATGHRPTWRLGQRGASAFRAARVRPDAPGFSDRFGLFDDGGPRPAPERHIGNAARKAFDILGLDLEAEASDIKAKYKSLVKRHHPDANGGEREAEERLIEIIKAYRYLREAGFC
jgi:hypothetical protein